VRYKKRLIFPSTSEVYGMSCDDEFDSENSLLVYGPISKSRWIYACSKQLMDRVIFAYGQKDGLRFTLFRPFNWIGFGLDSVNDLKEGSSRVVSQFLGQILRGEEIKLVDGGTQRRCFTDISDGIDALMMIIENPQDIADGKIYNIGNPANDLSIAELASHMVAIALEYTQFVDAASKVKLESVTGEKYYGVGYQDTTRRVPCIKNINHDLAWAPKIDMNTALHKLFEAYRQHPMAE
jgi:nucleoside-diphosphate-sugar epimerase